MKTISVIVGARPQFIKHAYLNSILSNRYNVHLINTGQHYDKLLSDVFFNDLDIPCPDVNLNVGSGTHGEQTGKMIIGIERELIKVKPDYVLVYGDTNSSLAGALAAVKLDIPVVHIESGLRSYDMTMPEEINRMLIDRISYYLYAPTQTAVQNLISEGVNKNKIKTFDVVKESLNYNLQRAIKHNTAKDNYMVATFHRKSNLKSRFTLFTIIKALADSNRNITIPLHPGTMQKLKEYDLYKYIMQQNNLHVIEPISYLEMIRLIYYSAGVITDSGGVQHEADILNIPCVTLRENTEWIESLDRKNVLVGNDYHKILKAIS